MAPRFTIKFWCCKDNFETDTSRYLRYYFLKYLGMQWVTEEGSQNGVKPTLAELSIILIDN